ncbi:AlwI family type II restriction endonuclease [Rothia nasimurium]|uniref:AlwI family type II restriction endonuclease n=1 Tax=Rothia nasimurium TaxID=85336 RepID=UPI001F377196|nr:AlwI family type II restriction endonuclease [Rothia nasimurium]
MNVYPTSKSLTNLGDTSFRRKNIAASYISLLEVLANRRDSSVGWSSSEGYQAEIYNYFRREAPQAYSQLGSKVQLPEKKRAQRARTNTNPLVKLGLVDDNRILTPLGKALSEGDQGVLDEFDTSNHLTPANAAIFRGVFRYRADLTDGSTYSPVQLLIRELVSRRELTEDQFRWIFILGPYMVGPDSPIIFEKTQELGEGCSLVEVLSECLSSTFTPEISKALNDFVVNNEFNPEYFNSQKSEEYTQSYKNFISALAAFRAEPSEDNLARLREANGPTSAKKAFGLSLPARNKKISAHQIHRDISLPGFHAVCDEEFRRELALWFRTSKLLSLCGEYFDLNRRTLQATGIFSFDNKTVKFRSIYSQVFFKTNLSALESAPVIQVGSTEPLSAELGVDCYLRAANFLSEDYGISLDQVENYAHELELERFNEMLEDFLPPEKVLRHLKTIMKYHPGSSAEIRELELEFDDRASIPTIYEYLLGIALYYASHRSFDILAAYNLALGGDFLPETHAPGMRGDIEIDFDGLPVLVEATLMDPSAQRRGELEPVLRHATNYEYEYPGSLTLFVANKLDRNVNRIFGFASLMKLYPTMGSSAQEAEATASPRIFGLETATLVELLNRSVDLGAIFGEIQQAMAELNVESLNSAWHDEITRKILM